MSPAWEAWRLDAPTWGWIVWLVYFAALETWAIVWGAPHHTLTYHLRPLFIVQPVTWFLALGLWLWVGVHFLAPTLEQWIVDVVSPWGGR